MKKINAQDVQQFHLNALLYGATGTGKTTSASTLPLKRTIIISAEAGILSLAGLDLEILVIESWADLTEAFVVVKNSPKDIVFVDTLTELNELAKVHILHELRPSLQRKTDKTYESSFSQDDWGELGRRMLTMIRSFRDLDKHVIMTCGESEREDQASGCIMVKPGLNGQARDQAPTLYDLVFRARVVRNGDKNEYYWQCQADETSAGKFRTPAGQVAPQTVKPNWSEVFASVLKKKGE